MAGLRQVACFLVSFDVDLIDGYAYLMPDNLSMGGNTYSTRWLANKILCSDQADNSKGDKRGLHICDWRTIVMSKRQILYRAIDFEKIATGFKLRLRRFRAEGWANGGELAFVLRYRNISHFQRDPEA